MITQAPGCTKKSRGRPKVFDREVMLDNALAVFWQHGYEATSLADLVDATGAKAPTLYAEFASKEGLFKAVLDRYATRFVAKHNAALMADDKTVKQALQDYLTALALCFSGDDTPAGCFFINTATTLSASSEPIAHAVHEQHARQAQTLLDFLRLRQQRGEIPSGTVLSALARFLNCVIQGMSVSAREGASPAQLIQITRTTMRLWPELVSACCHEQCS